jgi:hypothetical protein
MHPAQNHNERKGVSILKFKFELTATSLLVVENFHNTCPVATKKEVIAARTKLGMECMN